MRTTVNLDLDVIQAARAIARVEERSLGAVISTLARRGLAPTEARIGDSTIFPTFQVPVDASPITAEMVEQALDET